MENNSFKPSYLEHASERLAERIKNTKEKMGLILVQDEKRRKGFFSSFFSRFARGFS